MVPERLQLLLREQVRQSMRQRQLYREKARDLLEQDGAVGLLTFRLLVVILLQVDVVLEHLRLLRLFELVAELVDPLFALFPYEGFETLSIWWQKIVIPRCLVDELQLVKL